MTMMQQKNTFAVFSGQGSQSVGMGKELYENFAIARQLFEEASDSINVNIKKLCFDGPESDLQLTENTQPALLTISVAAFRVSESYFHFKPALVAGHSLGEYSALVCAGAFSFSSAIKWVRDRGLAMQSAVPPGEGSMAAVLGLEDDQVKALCVLATDLAQKKRKTLEGLDPAPGFKVPCVVEPANFNSPGQVVIAGSTDAVQMACETAKTDPLFSGTKCIPLPVSAPFHCSLMKPAKEKMRDLFATYQSKLANSSNSASPVLKLPYIPNRTGRIATEPGNIFELLVEQVDQAVLWKQSIETVLNNGFTHAVEFGPGRVLCGLIKRIDQGKKTVQLSVGDLASVKTLEQKWTMP